VRLAKKPSTAFSQEHEVGVKWKVATFRRKNDLAKIAVW
jgi:hypothetical protein